MRFLSLIITIVAGLHLMSCVESLEESALRLDGKASACFEERDYEAAVRLWSRAIDIGLKRSQSLRKMGRAYLHLADYDSALRVYERALALSPGSPELLMDIGQIHLLRWDCQAAEQLWEIVQPRYRHRADLLIFHGDLSILKNEFDAAETDYRQALSVDRGNKSALIKLAVCLLAQNRKTEAQKIYASLAAMQPESALILKQMGNYWSLADEFSKAEEMYLKAIAADPVNLNLKLALAEFYFDNKKYGKTIDILYSLISEESDTTSGKLLLIEALIAAGDLERADIYLSDSIKQRPNDIHLQLLRGKYYLMTHTPGLAISHLEFVVDIEPRMASANYLLGIAYLAAGHGKLGQQKLVKALSLDHGYTDAELVLADYYYKQYEYDIALEHASRILAREPDNFRAYQIRGNCYLAIGSYQKALLSFQKARVIRPDAVAPLYFAAVATEKNGEFEQAVLLYEGILKTHPGMTDVAKHYVDILIRTGETHKARAFLLDRLDGRDEDNGFVEFMLGKISLSLKEFDSAQTYFEASITKDNKNTAGYIALAGIYQASGAIAEQISVLRKAIEHNPRFSGAYVDLAACYVSDGDAMQAAGVLEKGLTMNPSNPIIQNNLAVLYLNANDQDKINKAFELAQRAYQRLASEPSANDTLGWAYFKKGLLKQAEWYLEEALRLAGLEDPAGIDATTADALTKSDINAALMLYHLGVVLHSNGDGINARKILESALTIGIGDDFQRDALRILSMDQQ